MENKQNSQQNMPPQNTKPVEQAKPKKSIRERLTGNPWVTMLSLAVLAGIVVFSILFYINSSTKIYIEKSAIQAPSIALGPQSPGVLEEIDVKEGDTVKASETVARVGNELIKAKVDGKVIGVENTIGKIANPGEAVVTMIDPTQLRVVGQIEEDKGLSDIRVGQTAVFTADAFGGKKYAGVVDEITPTSHDADVVFSISDQRQEKTFDIKVRFNPDLAPELLNGMSARIWIFK